MCVQILNYNILIFKCYFDLSFIKDWILLKRLICFGCVLACVEFNKGFTMRSPDKPPEFDIMTGFDDSLGVFFCDGLDIHQSVVVKALVETLVEAVVISLRVEG